MHSLNNIYFKKYFNFNISVCEIFFNVYISTVMAFHFIRFLNQVTGFVISIGWAILFFTTALVTLIILHREKAAHR